MLIIQKRELFPEKPDLLDEKVANFSKPTKNKKLSAKNITVFITNEETNQASDLCNSHAH